MSTETYLNCAETAKLARQALKVAFPKVKFSIRSKTYSMGASINVSWTDGPTREQVEAVAGQFHGASFDGSIDLKSHHSSMLNGQKVQFGADYIFFSRHESETFMANFRRAWCVLSEAERSALITKTNAWHGTCVTSWRCTQNLEDFGSQADHVFRVMASQVAA